MLTKKKSFGIFKLTEYALNRAVRSQTLLNIAALQINNYFWLQRNIGPTKEWVFKQFQIPTEDTLKPLYQTINRLEEENLEQKRNLKRMAEELTRLHSYAGEVYDNSQSVVDV